MTTAHAPTATPGGSNPMVERLRRGTSGTRAETSAIGRPRSPLKEVLAHLGKGLATLGVTAAAVTGCSSGPSGLARSPEPKASPPSSGQSIDPAAPNVSTPSSSATDPNAASPTSVPSIPTLPNADVGSLEFQLNEACEAEALQIAMQPRPTNDLLGPAYDQVSAALNQDQTGSSLRQVLDNYLVQEEATKGPDGKNLPEPQLLHDARHDRLEQYVLYTRAIYDQNPTKANYAEWQSAKDAKQRADKLPVQSGLSYMQPDWPSGG
ncbi:hypothetical protein GWC77_21430 [Paraburkholderia sp. NMBU_R16]|uniref:hypothetical protein n=1 Tax=Paraburkholderia sp. NMBU_R16 TaxID=2698676 RepID=UPI001565D428|nr:hypothetical protein [Paraburkholderia sp. NMBU_R16]NRO98489.1 hypothetical protein [Paraburkholderia sp. NMBU_R16]